MLLLTPLCLKCQIGLVYSYILEYKNEDKSFRHLSPLLFRQEHGYGNQVLPMIIVLDFILQGVYVFNLIYENKFYNAKTTNKKQN